jgi:hypothetical protein
MHQSFCVISGFRRDLDDICALLRYYVALNTDVSGQPIGPIFKGQEVFLTLEDWIDRLPRNVGTELPLNAA